MKKDDQELPVEGEVFSQYSGLIPVAYVDHPSKESKGRPIFK
jgi:hypothetical protein